MKYMIEGKNELWILLGNENVPWYKVKMQKLYKCLLRNKNAKWYKSLLRGKMQNDINVC